MNLNFLNKYFTGENFNSFLEIKYNFINELNDRTDILKDKFKNKNIIHLGCVDHLEIIEEKIKNDSWIHKIITDISKNCIGIDINKAGIDFIKNKGFENVYYKDITDLVQMKEIIKSDFKWDYLFLGEVLEHIDNPVDFLTTIRETYSGYIDKIVISVPNAFKKTNITDIFKNIERINTDHKYWFTPFTLSKVLIVAGFNNVDVEVTNLESVKNRGYFTKTIMKKFPLTKDTVLAIADF